jgi:hypothetical protein
MKLIAKDIKTLIEADDPALTVVELDDSSPLKEQVEFLKESETPTDPSTTIM